MNPQEGPRIRTSQEVVAPFGSIYKEARANQATRSDSRTRLDPEVEKRVRDAEERARKAEDKLIEVQGQLRDERIIAKNLVEALKGMAQTIQPDQQTEDPRDPDGYYRALGIDPEDIKGMSEQKVESYLKTIYRAHSMALHPDKGGDGERQKARNLAYEFLSDPVKRTGYGQS